MNPGAFTFDPFDPTEAHGVVTMCIALHGLPLPAPIPSERPEPPAVLAAGPGDALPSPAASPTNSDTAAFPPTRAAVAAGEALSGDASPACHPETATAPTACGAQPSGRGTLAGPEGSATFFSPAIKPNRSLATPAERGTLREAPAPAPSLADPADGPPQDGGQLRATEGSPAICSSIDWPALVACAAAADCVGVIRALGVYTEDGEPAAEVEVAA